MDLREKRVPRVVEVQDKLLDTIQAGGINHSKGEMNCFFQETKNCYYLDFGGNRDGISWFEFFVLQNSLSVVDIIF